MPNLLVLRCAALMRRELTQLGKLGPVGGQHQRSSQARSTGRWPAPVGVWGGSVGAAGRTGQSQASSSVCPEVPQLGLSGPSPQPWVGPLPLLPPSVAFWSWGKWSGTPEAAAGCGVEPGGDTGGGWSHGMGGCESGNCWACVSSSCSLRGLPASACLISPARGCACDWPYWGQVLLRAPSPRRRSCRSWTRVPGSPNTQGDLGQCPSPSLSHCFPLLESEDGVGQRFSAPAVHEPGKAARQLHLDHLNPWGRAWSLGSNLWLRQPLMSCFLHSSPHSPQAAL